MSSENPISKQEKPSPDNHARFSLNYHFGLSLEEYLEDRLTPVKIISKDEDTVLTLWKSKDGTEFMFRMFFKGDCKSAIVMDQAEFGRVVATLQEATSDS